MNQKQHLIAIDLDGTLLTDDKQITLPSRELITNLMSEGHIVVIATGRSHRMSIMYYNELGLTTPLINSNGGLIHHPRDKSWGNYHHPLNYKTALELIDISYELNSKNILAKVYDTVYLDQYDKQIIDFYKPKDDIDPFFVGKVKESLKDDPTLMLLYPDESNVQKLTEYLNTTYTEVINHRNWGAPFNIIEVMNKGMNKAVALKKIAEQYQIPQDRIIAFGDEGNDLEMIDYAGVGVAMGNATDELKSIANHVTKTNAEHGVAAFLADYFKVKQVII